MTRIEKTIRDLSELWDLYRKIKKIKQGKKPRHRKIARQGGARASG